MVKEAGFKCFCQVYLAKHFNLPMADFHDEMMVFLEDPSEKRLEIMGFRGSAKTTIASLAYPIYVALEKPDLYQFIIITGDTSLQASTNIANIKNELENNQLILDDYGVRKEATTKNPNPQPSLESEEEWQAKNMLLSNGVRILARSRGQKVRGLKHRQYRPKLIIVDDPEDLEWIKTKENRDKTERWLTGEVLPSLDENIGKIILIGNYLHEDALMKRMQKRGVFKMLEYPLLDSEKYCNWTEKYPTEESLKLKRQEIGETSWQREMMLKVVPEEGQPIKDTDIHFYDDLPIINRGKRGHGVDLAISEKQTADFTAMVSGDVYYDSREGGRAKIYVIPNLFHHRCDLLVLESSMMDVQRTGGGHVFFVEAVGYQKAAINDMVRKGLNVAPVLPMSDKKARLEVIAQYVKNGTVLFPHVGAEDLINELVNFGVEAHDDLCDAFVYLILGLIEGGLTLPVVRWL